MVEYACSVRSTVRQHGRAQPRQVTSAWCHVKSHYLLCFCIVHFAGPPALACQPLVVDMARLLRPPECPPPNAQEVLALWSSLPVQVRDVQQQQQPQQQQQQQR